MTAQLPETRVTIASAAPVPDWAARPTATVLTEGADRRLASHQILDPRSQRGDSTADRPALLDSGTEPVSASPPASPTAFPGSSTRVRGLHRWEGVVSELDDEGFTAVLTPVDHDSAPLEADFPLDKLPEEDLARLSVGSVVYLTVRTIVSARGRPESTAAIRLQRAGRWTAEEVDALRRDAAELSDALGDLAG